MPGATSDRGEGRKRDGARGREREGEEVRDMACADEGGSVMYTHTHTHIHTYIHIMCVFVCVCVCVCVPQQLPTLDPKFQRSNSQPGGEAVLVGIVDAGTFVHQELQHFVMHLCVYIHGHTGGEGLPQTVRAACGPCGRIRRESRAAVRSRA